MFAKGEVHRAAYLSDKRKLSEMLGIGIAARTTNGGHVIPYPPITRDLMKGSFPRYPPLSCRIAFP